MPWPTKMSLTPGVANLSFDSNMYSFQRDESSWIKVEIATTDVLELAIVQVEHTPAGGIQNESNHYLRTVQIQKCMAEIII